MSLETDSPSNCQDFCTSDVIDVVPYMEVEKTLIKLPCDEEVGKAIIAKAQAAPFGRGAETLHDPMVRASSFASLWNCTPGSAPDAYVISFWLTPAVGSKGLAGRRWQAYDRQSVRQVVHDLGQECAPAGS